MKRLIEVIKKYWKIIIGVIGTIIAGIIAFLSITTLTNKKIDNQVKKNEEDLKKIKEEKKQDEKTLADIDNKFKSSPFERARNKKLRP